MAIKFRCTACEKPLGIANRKAGSQVACVHCGQALTVPSASEAMLAAMQVQPSTPAADPLVSSILSGPPGSGPISISQMLCDQAQLAQADPEHRGGRKRLVVALLLFLLLGIGGVVSWRLLGRDDDELDEILPPGLLADLGEEGRGKRAQKPGPGGKDLIGPGLSPSGSTPAKDPLLIVPAPTQPPIVIPKVEAKKDPPKVVTPPPPVVREDELLRTALRSGEEALTTGNFEQALSWFKIAGEFQRTEEVLRGLDRAEAGRRQARAKEQARQFQEEQERKFADFERLMRQGNAAFFLKEFDNASKAYKKARQIFPGDVLAEQALAKTQQTKADFLRREQRDNEERNSKNIRLAEERELKERIEVDNALDRGMRSFREGDFAAAMRAYNQAKTLRPGDDDAVEGWLKAAQAKEAAELAADRRSGEDRRRAWELRKKKEAKEQIASFHQFLNDGDKLTRERNFDEAILAFLRALNLMPDDPGALQKRREAEEARDRRDLAQDKMRRERVEEARVAAATAQRQAQVLQQREADWRKMEAVERQGAQFQQFLSDGRLALAQRKFDVALVALSKAKDLRPADPEALQVRAQAQEMKGERDIVLALARKEQEELDRRQNEAARRKLEEGQKQRAGQEAKDKAVQQAQALERFLKSGQESLVARQFDWAIIQFKAAQAINPKATGLQGLLDKATKGNEVQIADTAARRQKEAAELAVANKELQRRQTEQARLEAEQQAKQDAQRKERDFAAMIRDGRTAQREGRFDLALNYFAKAKGIKSADPELATMIRQTQQSQKDEQVQLVQEAKKRAVAESQRAADQAKVDEEGRQQAEARTAKSRLADALVQGQTALKDKNYQSAIAAFTQALEIQANHAGAKDGLRRAQDGYETALRNDQLARDQKDQQAQRDQANVLAGNRAGDYDKYMGYGREAMVEKLYEAAIQAFTQALANRAGDMDAATALAEARQARDAAVAAASKDSAEKILLRERQKAEEAARQKKIDDERASAAALEKLKKQQDADALDNLLATARAALQLGQTKAATVALDAASQIAPNNPAVLRLRAHLNAMLQAAKNQAEQARIQDGLKVMPLDASQAKKVESAKFTLHMNEGRKLLGEGQIDRAIREFQAALVLRPGNQEAIQALEGARARLAAAKGKG